MLNDPDLRNVDYTEGDYVTFELFDADTWRLFKISRTALDVLSGGDGSAPLDSFERHIDRIKGVAFNQDKIEDGYFVLSSDHLR